MQITDLSPHEAHTTLGATPLSATYKTRNRSKNVTFKRLWSTEKKWETHVVWNGCLLFITAHKALVDLKETSF